MDGLGEELYTIIMRVYPELAPKLTGMLLQLGEEECRACLASQEKLAERLDEAFDILDVAGQGAATQKRPGADSNSQETEERRIDPDDGLARTLPEMRKLCAGRYSVEEIEEYWESCRPAVQAAAAPGGSRGATVGLTGATMAAAPPTPAVSSVARAGGSLEDSATRPAAAQQAQRSEAVPGFAAWLRELKLAAYAKPAAEWAEEQGACNLDEIVENLDDFVEALGFKPLERKRLMQGAEAAARVAQEVVLAAASADATLAEPGRGEGSREEEGLAAEGDEFPALGAVAPGRKKGKRRG